MYYLIPIRKKVRMHRQFRWIQNSFSPCTYPPLQVLLALIRKFFNSRADSYR